MNIESTIRAYQEVLTGFKFNEPTSFSEDFAIKRFQKKFQEPDTNHVDALSQKAWSEYMMFDQTLPIVFHRTINPLWYKARLELHRIFSEFSLDEFEFPKGTEFTPTRGKNSLEQRLCRSDWTCTDTNFDAFAALCYGHHGLKVAFRKRYGQWLRRHGFSQTSSDRLLYNHFKHMSGFRYAIFKWKLRRVTNIVRGSRFTTVPKNNEARRPINIEPFANILTQSQIGKTIRKNLLKYCEVDLNTLQEVHRKKISNLRYATIDLKNASDSVSLGLLRFLLPKRLCRLIEDRRSFCVLGPDDNYHVINKVSSMGNGFTFELMTAILTAVCRQLDPTATVYGDDIIIEADKASDLIIALTDVGFVVNNDKSFISGPFRESCGGNYHSEEGYIKSFDFHWPTTLHECVLLCNKSYYLKEYPSFKALYVALLGVTPPSLKGGIAVGLRENVNYDESPLQEDYFISPRSKGIKPRRSYIAELNQIHEYGTPKYFRGLQYVPTENSRMDKDLKKWQWAKYLSYLAAGRKNPDVLTDKGEWIEVLYVTLNNRVFRCSNLQ